jgi:CysZ protein
VSLFVDLARALAQIGDRRFMAVLLKGLGLTIAGLALVFWAVVAGLGWLLPDAVVLPWIGEVGFVDALVSWAAIGLMLVLSVVLMVPVAAIVVGFFLDDIAAAVEAEHYPALPPAEALPLSVQVLDALRFFGVLVGANLVAVVIYFGVPPLAPFVFWLVNGYLLGREYFQLVAMRRLGPEGAAALRRRHGARVWLAGVLMAVPLSVPVVNLLVPVLGVAVFTHQFHRLARG